MSPSTTPKKTGTIEVRVSDQLKAAFTDRCRQDEVTVSEAVRQLIEARLVPPTTRQTTRLAPNRLLAAGLFGAALGIGATAPAFAHATATNRSAFEALDRNHDRLLTFEEFRRQGHILR